jgi:hypothetical protein
VTLGIVIGVAPSGRAQLRFEINSELGPTYPSLRSHSAIMITTSDSSVKRSGTPNHYDGDLLHTIAISRFLEDRRCSTFISCEERDRDIVLRRFRHFRRFSCHL